mmetsp:Transcript_24527/g.68211  ORF Transcript_24527/g.68211 Transcript_24527/m.68211 type:complete len:245 (-) Transcript_24527:2159-2893(-)
MPRRSEVSGDREAGQCSSERCRGEWSVAFRHRRRQPLSHCEGTASVVGSREPRGGETQRRRAFRYVEPRHGLGGDVPGHHPREDGQRPRVRGGLAGQGPTVVRGRRSRRNLLRAQRRCRKRRDAMDARNLQVLERRRCHDNCSEVVRRRSRSLLGKRASAHSQGCGCRSRGAREYHFPCRHLRWGAGAVRCAAPLYGRGGVGLARILRVEPSHVAARAPVRRGRRRRGRSWLVLHDGRTAGPEW